MNDNDIYCKNMYGVYRLPSSHNRPVVNELKNGNVYEPATIKFILKNNNGDAIITAGTYVGDFLPAFKYISKVYAFEPSKENYMYSKINISLNNLLNVELKNYCLSNKNGYQNFITCDNGIKLGGGSHVWNGYCEYPNKVIENVESVTLDKYFENNNIKISIIQLDVEGHESEVLEGAINIIQQNKPIIIVESKPKPHIQQKLFDLDYSYHQKTLHANSILYIKSLHFLKFS